MQPYLGGNNWEFSRKTEAVLNVSKDIYRVSQNQVLFQSIYSLRMKEILHRKLSAFKVLMIDLENWRKSLTAPRKKVDVNTFSANELEFRSRDLLEYKRRFWEIQPK